MMKNIYIIFILVNYIFWCVSVDNLLCGFGIPTWQLSAKIVSDSA